MVESESSQVVILASVLFQVSFKHVYPYLWSTTWYVLNKRPQSSQITVLILSVSVTRLSATWHVITSLEEGDWGLSLGQTQSLHSDTKDWVPSILLLCWSQCWLHPKAGLPQCHKIDTVVLNFTCRKDDIQRTRDYFFPGTFAVRGNFSKRPPTDFSHTSSARIVSQVQASSYL